VEKKLNLADKFAEKTADFVGIFWANSLESDRFCNQEMFSGFAACPWFQNSLTFGHALLIRDVYQLMTFLCRPIQHCM